MSHDGGDRPEDLEDLLERELPGIERLPDRGRRVPPRRPGAPPRPRQAVREAPFLIERIGERIEGVARRADARLLDRLRRGEVEVDLRLDLHGRTAAEARRDVLAAADRARAEGGRCLLVVHGRGRRSPAGPVLKEALPGWLSTPPLARRVLAFATPPARLGGPGALLVLLD
jgi:DNA-nicking Smr family endonuclease